MSDALTRASALLAAPHASAPVRDGYLDTLGDAAPESTGRAQDAMLSRGLPLIYERVWRPIWGPLSTGPLGPSSKDEQRIARLLLGLVPGETVLDVACGPGNYTRMLGRVSGPAGLAVGLDSSPTMLRRAVADTTRPGIAYVRGDATALPFADAGFDAVNCFGALYLFPDPAAAIADMTRVLKPGGRLAAFTTCGLRSAPLRTLQSLGTRWGNIRLFDHDELTSQLAALGMQDVHQRVHGVMQFVGARRPTS